jgi:hypothetical protein
MKNGINKKAYICILCLMLLFLLSCSKKDKPVKTIKPDLTSRITKQSLSVLQAKINDLGAKARLGKYKDFSVADRAMLWLGFQSIVAAGRARGYDGAATVLDHYLAGDGKDLAVDPVFFRRSPVVIRALEGHYKKIALKQNSAKDTILWINPADHGWLDTNLRYMMNPFTLYIKDSLADAKIFSTYRIDCHIEFNKNSRTLFFLAGDTLVFPDNLGVALESLGMGKAFDLHSTWQDTMTVMSK